MSGEADTAASRVWLSVIVPAYNEEARLAPTLQSIDEWARERGESQPVEVIVADDGSTDGTVEVANRFVEQAPERFRVVSLERNRGKGRVVATGMLAARGELRLFSDADGSTPIEEVARLIARIDGGADVAIGVRLGEGDTEVTSGPLRRLIRWCFRLAMTMLGMGLSRDSQCGFKLFTRRAAEAIFSRLGTDGFGFDIEVLHLARRLGLRVDEVSINWHHQAGSKVRIVRDSLRMLRDARSARRRHRRVTPADLDSPPSQSDAG